MPPIFGEVWTPTKKEITFQEKLQVGDAIDALMVDEALSQVAWMRAKVVAISAE